MSDTLLEVSDLTVSYGGVRAVAGVSLTVPRGRCVSIVGANGAGKTSALRAIGGLEPAGGATRISLCGRPIHSLSAARRARLSLGHVLENRHVFGDLTVRQNLDLGALAADRRAAAIGRPDVHELLPELDELMDRSAGTLSGGQQQFLAIGRALAAGPTVLMLDEPTNGLAPMLVRRVVEIVKAICARGVGVLLVEQRLEVAEDIGQEVHVLQHGRVVHTTTGDDPGLAERVHAAYLG